MKNTLKKNTVFLTAEGKADLEKELAELKTVKLPELLERLQKAREDGDLSENSAYQSGKQEQEFIQGRIDELEEILQSATLIKKTNGNGKIVDVGCKVTVSVGGKKHVYTVVGDWEANPTEKKISGSSPLGRALMGRKIGEKAEVEAPAGKLTYTIVEIE